MTRVSFVFSRGASPLELPYTLARGGPYAPLRLAWLTRSARSRHLLGLNRGASPLELHARSRLRHARSVRVAHSLRSFAAVHPSVYMSALARRRTGRAVNLCQSGNNDASRRRGRVGSASKSDDHSCDLCPAHRRWFDLVGIVLSAVTHKRRSITGRECSMTTRMIASLNIVRVADARALERPIVETAVVIGTLGQG